MPLRTYTLTHSTDLCTVSSHSVSPAAIACIVLFLFLCNVHIHYWPPCLITDARDHSLQKCPFCGIFNYLFIAGSRMNHQPDIDWYLSFLCKCMFHTTRHLPSSLKVFLLHWKQLVEQLTVLQWSEFQHCQSCLAPPASCWQGSAMFEAQNILTVPHQMILWIHILTLTQ